MGTQTVLLTFSFALLEFANIVDAKFCAFELNGERRFYTCPRNEYCCNFGCCVSPAFQFYQLWYYWLLVIFMFLLCSGGGWWYRYWLQNRYRTCPGSILPVTNSNTRHSRVPTRATSSQPRRPSRPRVARVSYNPSRDAVVLHRIWKGPRNCPPPSYTSAQGEVSTDASNQSSAYHSSVSCPPVSASSLFPPSHVAQSSSGIGTQECPYYQLYGPPPSYDSVMSEIGENSLPPVHPVNVNTDVSPTQPETTNATSSRGDLADNVIMSQQSPSESAGSPHHDNSPLAGISDKLSIATNDVQAGQSTNVQNQHSDTYKQTQKREDNSTT